MVRLKADFEADWIGTLRDHMIVQGWYAAEVQSLDDRDISIHYFESLRRRLAMRPRVLKAAKDFSCPADMRVGWTLLQPKVRTGGDLNPHLSLRHASLLNRDGLFAEWGIHHFHLGTAPYPKNPAYIGRTPSLVYALVDDETFYAINVYGHQDFEEGDVLETLHQNWPERIARYRVNGVTGGGWTKFQRRTLRNGNCNVAVTVADGTVYMPISGGVTVSGRNGEAIKWADYWKLFIRDLQCRFEQELVALIPALERQGYRREDEIAAELLRIVSTGYQVFFPKYSVLVNVTFQVTDNPASMMSPR